MTFTGLIGAICLFPLRAIIRVCVLLRIHPNVLTLVGVIINVAAAWALALGRFVTAGVIMVVANIFDFIDGKVARERQIESAFGGFWDSVMDRVLRPGAVPGARLPLLVPARAPTTSSSRRRR